MTRLIVPLIVALVVTLPLPVSGQDITPRQEEILRETFNTGGWLTEGMHKEFWSLFPKSILSNPKLAETFVTSMSKVGLVGMKFQREVWLSIRKSLNAQKIMKTHQYENAKSDSLSASNIPSYLSRVKQGVKNAEAMIVAAANRKPMVSHRGTFYITEEMVDQVLTGLDGSFYRFRRLTNPKWGTKTEEISYPKAHIRILWDGPFRREYINFDLENGISSKAFVLSQNISKNELVQVSFSFMNGVWENPEKGAERVTSGLLEYVGAASTQTIISKWRGRVTVHATGASHTPEGIMHTSIRTIEAPEHQGYWQIIGISHLSEMQARLLRGRIEQAVMLD